MTRDEKIALCRRLHGEGYSVREIAERTGIARSTAGDYLLGDEHRRAVELGRGFKCPNCRQPVPEPIDAMCRDCIADGASEKALKVERMWLAGGNMRAIAAELGWTVNCLGVMMHRYREQGYNLPYRYTEGGRAGRKFPDQVAA